MSLAIFILRTIRDTSIRTLIWDHHHFLILIYRVWKIRSFFCLANKNKKVIIKSFYQCIHQCSPTLKSQGSPIPQIQKFIGQTCWIFWPTNGCFRPGLSSIDVKLMKVCTITVITSLESISSVQFNLVIPFRNHCKWNIHEIWMLCLLKAKSLPSFKH